MFQSQPRAIPGSRKKYREPSENSNNQINHPQNIMYDKRVIRGSTYARAITPSNHLYEGENTRTRSRHTSRQGVSTRRSAYSAHSARPMTPEAIPGRTHVEVQTYELLEYLSDKPAESETCTQTDPTMDRPMSPLFVPKPTGIDKSTDIAEGDLFDFDQEVEPILEVLVGKTLDHALMEVLEEEELKTIENNRRKWEQKRNIALVEVQRIEAAEKRRDNEKERRLQQEKERIQQERIEERLFLAKTFAKEYLETMQDNVIDRLEKNGFFYDPLRKEVEEEFIPWLVDAAANTLNQYSFARSKVQELLLKLNW